MSPLLLQLSNVTKSFGAVCALKGVSFTLHPGEVHAVVGENGAGKSTLIKIITGAHQPDSGGIQIDGQDVARLSPAIARRLGIACIYQQPALFPDLTVAENIVLGAEPGSVASLDLKRPPKRFANFRTNSNWPSIQMRRSKVCLLASSSGSNY